MSTVTVLPTLQRRPHPGRLTQARVALSESTKLRTLRSTRYSLLAAFVMTIGFAVTMALVFVNQWGSMSAEDKAGLNPLETSQIGVTFAQLAIGVLGVMIISGEYSTGMIRSTFAAVPKRLPVLGQGRRLRARHARGLPPRDADRLLLRTGDLRRYQLQR